ncbi:MAG: hypothetical protein RIR86_175, partial [Acidobacteriota bacterium]
LSAEPDLWYISIRMYYCGLFTLCMMT